MYCDYVSIRGWQSKYRFVCNNIYVFVFLSGTFPSGAKGARRLLEDFQHSLYRFAGRARRRVPAYPQRRQEHVLEVPARLRPVDVVFFLLFTLRACVVVCTNTAPYNMMKNIQSNCDVIRLSDITYGAVQLCGKMFAHLLQICGLGTFHGGI